MATSTLPNSPQTKDTSTKAKVDKRLKILDVTIKKNGFRQDALIEILHKVQSTFGYLEKDVLAYIAHKLQLPFSEVYGVATFYHLFSLEPSGKHKCVICLGTACYVKGSSELLDKLAEETNLHPGETSENGEISLMTARCIGACGRERERERERERVEKTMLGVITNPQENASMAIYVLRKRELTRKQTLP